MVWGRMGLLDEAIRDHLELKRRRGADPTEIARVEREALEPVFPEEPPLADPALEAPHGDELAAALPGAGGFADGLEPAQELDEPHLDPYEAESPREGELDPAAGQAGVHSEHLSILGQETAELDMRAVLDEGAGPADGAGVEPMAHAEPDEDAQHATPPAIAGGTTDDGSPEWELPEHATAEPPPEPLPGQERLTFE